MGQMFNTIQRMVAEEKYVIGEHASERLEERGVMEWQAVAGLTLCDSLTLGLAVLALATVPSRKTGASAQTANTSDPNI